MQIKIIDDTEAVINGEVTDSFAKIAEFDYDREMRVLKVVRPDGQISSRHYFPEGDPHLGTLKDVVRAAAVAIISQNFK